MKKNSKRAIAALLSASMVLTGSMSVMAATTDSTISQREIENKTSAKDIAAQGMVLLENNGNSLPISSKAGTKVALFGQGVYNTVQGGTGSGSVNQRDNVTVLQGFQNAGYDVVNEDFISEIEELSSSSSSSDSSSGGGGFGNMGGMDMGDLDDMFGGMDMGDMGMGGGMGGMGGSSLSTEPIYTDVDGGLEAVEAAAAQTDTAIYVIARNSGEGSDRTVTKGDYLLSDDEEANLTLLGQEFDNVVVVLNVGGVIDTKFFDEIDGLDSMLLMSQAGMTGGDAVVEVLNGTVNPSGKLTDT